MTNIIIPNSIYPFKISEIKCFSYYDYKIINVFRNINDEQRESCVKLWMQSKVLSSEKMAWQRSHEVCYLFFHAKTLELAGLNTIYIDCYSPQNANYFFNRMFIRPCYRDSRLMVVGTAAAVCYLRTHHGYEGIRGVINMNGNQKLYRKGVKKLFERGGYCLDGIIDGKETWRFEFDKISFIESN